MMLRRGGAKRKIAGLTSVTLAAALILTFKPRDAAALDAGGAGSGKPIAAFRQTNVATGGDWPYYNGDPGGTHYSPLAEISIANVAKLQVAWTFDTGDAMGSGPIASDMECNPLAIGGRLYIVSPKGRLIALDGESGRLLWSFDPAAGGAVRTRQRLRGVSYWSDAHDRRILFTFRTRLYAVDADTGRPAASFGEQGSISLASGIDRDPTSISVGNVSPGVVWRDLIVLGSTGNLPGTIRAFDVRSGKLVWVFHTIPYPGEVGYETWPKDAWKTLMGANNWAGMSLDASRGVVFVPLASGGMGDKDFYGADRRGNNLFANSLVALDAATGRRLWHFQTVRHDLWDRDLPAAPTLVTVVRDGRRIDAVALITKSGLVYILDRVTGLSLFPIEERATFPSAITGEHAAATQPAPLRPLPFARQHLTADLLTRRSAEASVAAKAVFAGLSSRGPFDPPSERGTIILPGLDGGGEWGGAAYDPETGRIFVNANEMAWILKLRRRPPPSPETGGAAVYRNNCSGCHGEDLRGSPPEFPSLIGVGTRLPETDILLMVLQGGGRMPSFAMLGIDKIHAVIGYLRTGKDTAIASAASPGGAAAPPPDGAYAFDGYTKFLDKDGYPAIAPPWGTLSAIDVSTGDYAWKIPFGVYPELEAQGLHNTGSENYGGAVVTAGGLLFIAATVYDPRLHAFDKRTGKLLWSAPLPAAGNATPATYRANGRQFVVIAAGGGKNKSPSGGKIVAYALPSR